MAQARRNFLLALCASSLALGLVLGLAAQPARAAWPERPVTIIVPFAAGSSNDGLARLVQPSLQKNLGQPIIVENRPGADALIGIELLAKSAPDGYHILFSGGAVSLLPALRINLPWDPIKDIQPVAQIGASSYLIGVTSKYGFKTSLDLVNYAKANPGKLNAAAGGNSSRMSIEQFQVITGAKVTIVPYPGTGQAATSVLQGETDFAIMDSAGFTPLMDEPKVSILAVTSAQRLPTLPKMPTATEQGFNFVAGTFFGVYAPGATPMPIIQRLNAELGKSLADPQVMKALDTQGLDPRPASVEEFTAKYRNDVALWKEVVTKAGIPRQ